MLGPELQVLIVTVLFLGLLTAGMPVPFAIAVPAVIYLLMQGGFAALSGLGLMSWGSMNTFALTAVPLFMFMADILSVSGLSNRIYNGLAKLVAPLPGGLLQTNIAGCAIFASVSGSSIATAASIGGVALPQLTSRNYNRALAAGSLAAGGTLGILIPPSVMLIVMGPVVGVPATDLFAAAVIPGLLLSGLYIIYALVRSYMNPALGPALPVEERAESFGIVVKELLIGIAPIVVVILATLGVILAGIATPTDAGAVGSFAVLLLTLLYRRMSWDGFCKAVYSTLEVSCMILLLVAASNYFGAVFSRLGSANLIAESLLGLSFSPTTMLLLILGIIFVLGWPLEWVPIVLIVVPILLPLVTKLGIDLVWFCTLVAVCLQTAWLSPPVALSAYFLKGVVPDWSLKDIYAGMMQFMVLQIIGLLLVLFFPQLALFLPNTMFR